MYCKPDSETFTVDGMQILFSVYSPNGVHTAKALLPDLEKMMRAQKAFLGSINSNKKTAPKCCFFISYDHFTLKDKSLFVVHLELVH